MTAIPRIDLAAIRAGEPAAVSALVQAARDPGFIVLDGLADADIKGRKALQKLRMRRQVWLRDRNILKAGETALSEEQRTRLRAMELKQQSEAIAERSNRTVVDLANGDRFKGLLEEHVDLASGRMAIISNDKQFALVPWRTALGRQMGREMTVQRTARGIGWTLGRGRSKGLSR